MDYYILFDLIISIIAGPRRSVLDGFGREETVLVLEMFRPVCPVHRYWPDGPPNTSLSQIRSLTSPPAMTQLVYLVPTFPLHTLV